MLSIDTMMVTACCLGLVYAAGHDIAVRTIPNWVSLCIGCAGFVHAIFAGRPVAAVGVASIIFCVGLLAWRVSLLGGGDVKLMTAVSFWVRPQTEPELLLLIAVAGGLVACLYLLAGAVAPRPASHRPPTKARRIVRVELRRMRRRQSIPYAVAIASATIVCLAKG